LNFEESLVYELSSITGLEDRIFPLGAKEGTKPPFVIYVSSEGEDVQNLTGYTGDKEITCEIHIVGKNYAEMKGFARAVIDKLKTFYGRQIGENGVYIKSFSYIEPVEEHDQEFNYERTSFDIKVRI
jgi:hypothetical protein